MMVQSMMYGHVCTSFKKFKISASVFDGKTFVVRHLKLENPT